MNPTGYPSTGLPQAEVAPTYSIPEYGKESYDNTEPGIFVSHHKTLPHIGKRRQYGVGDSNSTVPVNQVPSTSPGNDSNQKGWSPSNTQQTSAQPEAKPKSGLDLDLVPRPNVIANENTLEGIKFSAKPQIPNPISCPSAFTRYYTPDEGCSIPRLFRVTSQCLLIDSTSFLNTSGIPFGAIAQPFAEVSEHESQIPLSQFGGEELIRCTRCGAYINPAFGFIDAGNTLKCNICEGMCPTKSPVMGGEESRPELCLGTYDFIAPQVLNGKKLTGNNFLLVIDCTQNSINYGNYR